MNKAFQFLTAVVFVLAALVPTLPVQALDDDVIKTGIGDWILACDHFSYTQRGGENVDYPIMHVDVYSYGGVHHKRFYFDGQISGEAYVNFSIHTILINYTHISSRRGLHSHNLALTRDTRATCDIPAERVATMYVYYSETPWAGDAHTLTVFSGVGFPSETRLTQLAGGTLPKGFDFSQGPVCWGGLFDDGTNRGYFVCDEYLAAVHERRANLRNDPNGPAFDLEPKIEAYKRILAAQGLHFTP